MIYYITKFQTNVQQKLCLSNPIVITLRQLSAEFDSCFCKLKLCINTLSDIELIVTINFTLNGRYIYCFWWSSSLQKPKEPTNASNNEWKTRLNKFDFLYSKTKDKAADQKSILWFWRELGLIHLTKLQSALCDLFVHKYIVPAHADLNFIHLCYKNNILSFN